MPMVQISHRQTPNEYTSTFSVTCAQGPRGEDGIPRERPQGPRGEDGIPRDLGMMVRPDAREAMMDDDNTPQPSISTPDPLPH